MCLKYRLKLNKIKLRLKLNIYNIRYSKLNDIELKCNLVEKDFE